MLPRLEAILIVVIFLSGRTQSVGVLSWFWGEASEDNAILVADGVPLVAVPYEIMTEDEKFLRGAAELTDVGISSPLETCQHRVVMKIRTSCGEMTEEQLAKLGVNLLNCQSAAEGRKLFPCDDDMSLKQCTTDMDADMWNAYHLISNRARAVCYTARNTQFRALTELTVNKLMQTAHSQIKALDSLKESQQRLEDQTLEALGSLSEGNQVLLQQQRYLRDAQTTAHNLVASNLRELNNEKALIRAGHAQLASLTEDIKAKLEKSSSELMSQAMERHANHREVLEDLMRIEDQARLIWDKIESSTNRIVAQNAEAAARYEETIEKLGKINETIHFIWNVTESMRSEVDEKLGWITEYIGDTSEQFNRFYRTSLHLFYLLGAMIVASFLQAPFTTRATIMGIIPINLTTFLKHGSEACLDFTSITVLIFMITGMHYLLMTVQYICGSNKKSHQADTRHEEHTAIQNGSSIRGRHERSSSPETLPPLVKRSVRVRTLAIIVESLRTIARTLINQKDKTLLILRSAASWCRRNATPVEELSCSYLPSRKNREDFVTHYGDGDFPSMSEDSADFDGSANVTRERYYNYENGDSLVDARDLRRRIMSRNDSPTGTNSTYRSSESRSVTPNGAAPSRNYCGALTKSGSKCRSRATIGGFFCGRHRTGSSIMGD